MAQAYDKNGDPMPARVQLKSGLKYEEQKLAEYMEFNCLGSFYTAFFKAVTCADLHNLMRLRLGFPEELAAWDRYMIEGPFWRK